jgi:hypothetical protein
MLLNWGVLWNLLLQFTTKVFGVGLEKILASATGNWYNNNSMKKRTTYGFGVDPVQSVNHFYVIIQGVQVYER